LTPTGKSASLRNKRIELLIVTSSWPNATVPEFLDEEIHHLARVFNRIVVAPVRPRAALAPRLPQQVSVDYTLAQHLEHTRWIRSHSSRHLTAAVRGARPNRHGFGFSAGDLAGDWRHRAWIRSSLIGRSDSTSVASWAARFPAPDVAYTFWLSAATVALRDAWPDVRLVSRVHGGDLYPAQHGWRSIPFQEAAARSVDRLATVSLHGRENLVARFPQLASRIVVRRLGIVDLGEPAPRSRHGAIRLLSASSIDQNKRVRLIWEVACELARAGSEVQWTHYGDGPGRAELDHLVGSGPRRLTVAIKGHVPADVVHRELRSGNHDVFINLSLSEGAPVSLIEAQCVGMPVVATAVGGTPEVAPGRFNELVSTDDGITTLAQAIVRAYARPAEEGAARRDHWARNYRADDVYPAWAQELRELCASDA
jgi:colanic acid/amylovoran biosynthesis glycosyltransferase